MLIYFFILRTHELRNLLIIVFSFCISHAESFQLILFMLIDYYVVKGTLIHCWWDCKVVQHYENQCVGTSGS